MKTIKELIEFIRVLKSSERCLLGAMRSLEMLRNRPLGF